MTNQTCIKCNYPVAEGGKCRVIGCLASWDALTVERDEARAERDRARKAYRLLLDAIDDLGIDPPTWLRQKMAEASRLADA